MKLSQLKAGQAFEIEGVEGYEWIALEHNVDRNTTLVIASNCIKEMAFDKEGSNDFRNSSIRKYLNNDFLEELTDEGLDKDGIVFTDFDLTNYNGENIYGFCRDKIGLLTINQYKKYKEYLELDDWWWLITSSASSPEDVYLVGTSGALNLIDAYYGLRGVRPALNLKSDISVSLMDDECCTEDRGLENYSSEELLQELLRREAEM